MKMPTVSCEISLKNDIHPHMTSLFDSYSPTVAFMKGSFVVIDMKDPPERIMK